MCEVPAAAWGGSHQWHIYWQEITYWADNGITRVLTLLLEHSSLMVGMQERHTAAQAKTRAQLKLKL